MYGDNSIGSPSTVITGKTQIKVNKKPYSVVFSVTVSNFRNDSLESQLRDEIQRRLSSTNLTRSDQTVDGVIVRVAASISEALRTNRPQLTAFAKSQTKSGLSFGEYRDLLFSRAQEATGDLTLLKYLLNITAGTFHRLTSDSAPTGDEKAKWDIRRWAGRSCIVDNILVGSIAKRGLSAFRIVEAICCEYTCSWIFCC